MIEGSVMLTLPALLFTFNETVLIEPVPFIVTPAAFDRPIEVVPLSAALTVSVAVLSTMLLALTDPVVVIVPGVVSDRT